MRWAAGQCSLTKSRTQTLVGLPRVCMGTGARFTSCIVFLRNMASSSALSEQPASAASAAALPATGLASANAPSGSDGDGEAPRARALVFLATSLDGFIARLDGSMDWLDYQNTRVTPAGEDCGFAAFFARVDALLMGRETFEWCCKNMAWTWGTKPVMVLSRTLSEKGQLEALVPEAARGTAHVLLAPRDATPLALLQHLHSSLGARHVYLDGGVTIQSFLAAGLVDEMTITTVPVMIGRGRPLFAASASAGSEAASKPLLADTHLELIRSQSWPFGFVQNTWKVLHKGPREAAAAAVAAPVASE